MACRQLHHFLWGTKVLIKTDHQPLVSVFRQRTQCPRMNRWMLEMRDYRYKIEYKSGKQNKVADPLSRPVRILWDENFYLGRTKEELSRLQIQEPRWREMKDYLEGGRIPRAKFPRTTLN